MTSGQYHNKNCYITLESNICDIHLSEIKKMDILRKTLPFVGSLTGECVRMKVVVEFFLTVGSSESVAILARKPYMNLNIVSQSL